MRRNARLKKHQSKTLSDKIILYCGIGVVFLTVIVFALLMYSKSLNEDVKNSTMTLEQMANIAGNNTSNTQSASTQIGKSVEELEKENNTNTQNTTSNTNSTNTNSNTTNTTGNNVITTNSIRTAKQNTPTNTTNTNLTKQETTEKTEPKTELSFVKPVEGVISSKFGQRDTATGSVPKNHTGTDIAANLGTKIKSATDGEVVLASEEGDYGKHLKIQIGEVSIIYAHCNDLYVKQGEMVKQGQEIAEVGSTRKFNRTTSTF